MAAFVKFSRGLISTFERLNSKDPNTLYLVYADENAETGKLYLGNKLISSVSNENISLGQLIDVSLNAPLQDGMILQYNNSTGGAEGTWQPVLLEDIGGGSSSNHSNVTVADALESITNPKDNDIGIINNNAYVYTDGEWHQLTNSSLEDRINTLETLVGTPGDEITSTPATGLFEDIANLNTSISNLSDQISQNGHLKYQIVSSIDDILVGPEADYTIYLAPKEDSETDNLYDEYFVINGALEKIGNQSVGTIEIPGTIDAENVTGLTDVITNTQFIKSVDEDTFKVTPQGELQLKSIPSSVLDLSNYVTTATFNSTVNEIKESIVWRNLTGEEES